ncbi:MAG: hypothetical protein OEW00_08600 [candidate division Zixibacteria bacterium]|nr:hypothetical protein [candidate division Zixibacteria bacterium]
MDFEQVKIVVNGKEIEKNAFVERVLGNTLWGLVSSLKLEAEPKEIDIRITKKTK